jgi:Arc/MetJ family transcription regulator
MVKRTTIEIDEDLLARAKQSLGGKTTRATVEEALRRLTAQAESDRMNRSVRQQRYLERLATHVDLAVLESEEMWR